MIEFPAEAQQYLLTAVIAGLNLYKQPTPVALGAHGFISELLEFVFAIS